MKLLYTLLFAFFISCSTEPEDCAGVAGGSAEEDMCGVCDSDATNDCTQDCAGVWGGLSYLDECGGCDANVTNDNTTCTEDCAGIINGDAVVDECGVCDGDNSTCMDCAGIINGDAVVDDCGVCNGDGILCIENTQVEVDKFENELFLQAEVTHNNNISNIVSVTTELSIYNGGIYNFLGSFILYDNGQHGDIIPGNGIYSLLTTAEELIIIDVEPEINSINMASHYQLAHSESDSLEIELTVGGKLLKVIFTAEDINGVSTQYTEYINLSNTYIEIQINSDGMYKDKYPNDEDICEREWNLTNYGFLHYFNIVNYSQLGSTNNFTYSTKIPFRSLGECGGTGEAFFKFNVHDMDFSNCLSSQTNACLGNLTSTIERSLIISGCGDNYCTDIYENSLNCSEDCE